MSSLKVLFFIKLLGILVILNGCQKIPTSNEELPKDGSSLTLFFIPSPFGINWSSPRKLFTSIALNYISFRPHFMGHVAIQVSCTDLSNKQHDFITGMSASKFHVLKPIFKDHYGLGIVFQKFPGQIDDSKKSEQELIYRLKNPGSTSGVNFIQYKINQAACTRLVKYHNEYTQHQIFRYYGLYNRPLYGEGAGCSAYGASFVELIGLMNDELKQAWSYQLELPKNLIGKPLTDNNAYFWDIFFAKSWGEPGTSSMSFFFWEPDKMYLWVHKTLEKNYLSAEKTHYLTKKLFNTNGLFFNATGISVPSEPIWKKTDREFYSELLELNKQLYESAL